jgi:tetratricopeptide (TPR) repeat protein
MPQPRKSSGIVEGVEKTAAVLAGTDYGIDPEDFILYELHRLIEEDRASFDDADFRNLIDEGIRAHIQDNLGIRAHLAGLLRSAGLKGEAHTVATRVVHALEDLDADLCNVAVLVRNYTGYLLSKLEDVVELETTDEKVTTAADLLFESTGDRSAAETALDILCATRSPVSARVLAHAVSEPLLDEDLEARALAALKTAWPLPRHYMLYSLREHPHEDIPIRWFQLFVEVDELKTVDLVLEELRAHGEASAYLEDIAALVEVLHGCRDPELDDKVLDAVNSPSISAPAQTLLRKFLQEHRPVHSDDRSPWARQARNLELNRQYLSAAGLFERGETEKALQALKKILAVDADYPFAVMLREIIREIGEIGGQPPNSN